MDIAARYGLQQNRQATLLLESVQRLAKRRHGRLAVHLRLSQLVSDSTPPQHMRIAVSVFETGIQGLQGELFVLDNFDVVFIGLAREATALQKAVEKVDFLLQGDPLADSMRKANGLARWFDLGLDYEEFLSYARQLAVEEEQRRLSRASIEAQSTRRQPRQELDLSGLAQLERALNSADISSLVRQQAVCAIGKNMRPSRVLTEFFTSIREVEKVLSPDTDLAQNRLLFQYLTQILDKRMLAYLRHAGDRRFGRYISLNLNVASLLSPSFLSFDADLPVGVRGKIIIELQQPDVYADLRAYSFARDLARQQGYRLCLDGVTRHSLPLIDRAHLDMEFVKLVWNDELRGAVEGKGRAEIRAAVERVGLQHLILHRCETEEVVRQGQELGIQLFQGHYIDALLPLEEQRAGRSALDEPQSSRKA
ncbi:EAL domain-containing protein [Tistlia consotensis]|uniref:EAL domain-containing protein n=1 Tax=Tistlia consotensis USBA 355 TaxID=560819 RepID=A0A1Y6CNU2_9PROT|nr:EAL domain-containing protein [Tistlia consotensis]SMF79824.1 EAL domain-containing protein [Tistlia consotensis USBA 355]SNS16602.1 EAL domain-containing protein [Tistlia consotensis]